MFRCILLLLPLFILSCSDDTTGPETPTPLRPISSGELALARANSAFGFSLFTSVTDATPEENVFLSPLSVMMALGMTVNGAAGETWTGMRQALHFEGMTQEEINQSCHDIMELLLGMDPQVRLDIANSIWSRAGYAVEEDFIETNRRYFDADIESLDFDRADAAGIINAWVSRMTQGRIPEIVAAPIPDWVVMYIINAVYFKGTWTQEFDPSDTRDDSFIAIDGSSRPVKMMQRTGSTRYTQDDLVEMVDLPYGWDRYSMAVLLPREGVSLAELRKKLSTEQWDAWVKALKERDVALQLPRFTLEYEVGLNDVLASMGMEAAFAPGRADFSGINPENELFISAVRHKTFVQVNEEGTEAAAVTSVEIGVTSVPSVTVMRVDRPFVFVIHERNTGAILFIGQLTDI
ncbi:MAG: serpin family protein [Bacteroidetes bacterium]|nr:serpin family protein [Bacteroidota bacterium]